MQYNMIISHTTKCSSLQTHNNSTSAVDTNGNQKIIADWNFFTKSTDCNGLIITTHFEVIKGWSAAVLL